MNLPMPSPTWSIACWHRPVTASVGDGTGWTSSAGDNADDPIPEIRLYRDDIINAFNTDKPYDQFVREPLAGDILAAEGPPEHFAEQVIATGFLALSHHYATGPYELWHLTLEDTIETTGRAFLGLTLRCARCHDHKFDPVTQRDDCALFGIFASTRFPYAGSEEFSSMARPRAAFTPLTTRELNESLISIYKQFFDYDCDYIILSTTTAMLFRRLICEAPPSKRCSARRSRSNPMASRI